MGTTNLHRAGAALAVLSLCVATPAHRRHHRHHAHHAKRRVFSAPMPPHQFGDAGHPVKYSEFKVGHVRYYAVTANLADPDVQATTVFNNGSTTVWKLVGRREAACAAITGTFFCPQSGWPVGDVVVDGALKAEGKRGSAIAIGYDGKAHVFDTSFGKEVDWSSTRWALRGTVRLVHNGHATPNPKAQKFHDPAIWSRVARTGAGVTKNGKLVLIATGDPISLHEFGRAMASLGVVDGVSLDGGSSTCLFYRGVMLIHPARRLSNMLVIAEKKNAPGAASHTQGAVAYLNQ